MLPTDQFIFTAVFTEEGMLPRYVQLNNPLRRACLPLEA